MRSNQEQLIMSSTLLIKSHQGLTFELISKVTPTEFNLKQS